MRSRLLLLLVCLAAACFHRIYNDPHACLIDADCTIDELPFCYAGRCSKTPAPDGGLGDMPPQMCKTSTECTVTTQPVCDTSAGLCRGCTVEAGRSQDCLSVSGALPYCTNEGACVECRTGSDCIEKGLACKSNQCKPCVTNDECASGLCQTGTCANPNSVVYVQQACTMPPGTGEIGNPFCKVADGIALGASVGKPVVVLPGSYAENITLAPSALAFSVRVIGVGKPTVIGAATSPVFSLSNSAGHTVNVSLEGLHIQGGSNGVDCVSAAANRSDTKLKVAESEIVANAQLGVSGSKCDITIDQTRIGPTNLAGGVQLAGCDFVIKNTAVFKNGSSTSDLGGIQFSGTYTNGWIINDTIYGNTAKTGALVAAGLSCTGSPIVFNTVVLDNVGGTGSDMAAGCNPTFSAYKTVAPAVGNQELLACSADTIFTAAATNDFHPKSGGLCTLIDVGASMAGSVNAPTYDLDGNVRPKGGGFDIGAYEVP